MLYEAFDTPNRIRIARWEKTGVEVASRNTLVAELGSLSLEFTRLSRLTGDPKFFDAVQRIINGLDEQQNKMRLSGTWSVNVNARELDSFDEQTVDKKKPFRERLREKALRLRLPMGVTAVRDWTYSLRPEAIESIFVLYRITGDERLREDARNMFEAIVAETRTDIAFASIDDLSWKHSPQSYKMESFWMAETLKYFYLDFSEPDVVSLDNFVSTLRRIR